jgi:hypothetical protein
MSDISLSPIESLASGIYAQQLTLARSAALENMMAIFQRFVEQHATKEPLYMLVDASSLDIAYTPRAREHVERVTAQIHHSNKTLRVALVLPEGMGSCTTFLNNLLRSRETSQTRHLCFARREDALVWLQDLQRSESLPAAQGF